MKLFLKEHIPLIIFSLVQIVLIVLVFWFGGQASPSIVGYAVFLGVFVLLSYLVYRYASESTLYRKLSNRPEKLEETIEKTNSTPLAQAVASLLQSQYRHYQKQLAIWEDKQRNRLTFMNQWVHQMKTPLSVIELITQTGDNPSYESIAEETDRLRKGLEMVLYASRLETFTEDFYVEEVSLVQIVNKAIHDNKQYFIRNFVYPEVKVDAALTVKTDRKWLRFILNQLLTNAIKYSAGSREKITVTAYLKNGNTILEIIDRGVGIPKADVKRVFQPFFTGENGRVFKESTGMGLYLVKEVVDKLNHQIEIESTVGKGTTVRLTFFS